MGMVLKDLINNLVWDSYDIIQDLIGYYYLHNADIDKSRFVKELFNKIMRAERCRLDTEYISRYASSERAFEKAGSYSREITLEEFRRYTVELYKIAIYDECTILESVEEFNDFNRSRPVIYAELDIETIKNMNRDKLYQFISDFFDWMYEQDYTRNKMKMIEKLDELENKYCEDVNVITKVQEDEE